MGEVCEKRKKNSKRKTRGERFNTNTNHVIRDWVGWVWKVGRVVQQSKGKERKGK